MIKLVKVNKYFIAMKGSNAEVDNISNAKMEYLRSILNSHLRG